MKTFSKLIMIVLSIVVLLTGCSYQTKLSPVIRQADQGVLDLSSLHEYETDKLFNLSGEWEFYWDQLLSPEDLKQEPELTGYLNMPANWNTFILNGTALPRHGYATFALNIKVKDPELTRGIHIPVMYSNYKLWIDGNLAAVSGHVGKDAKSSIPDKSTQVVYFTPNSEQIRIVLQISNFDNYAGGMWEPLRFGSYETVQASHIQNLAFTACLIGIVIMTSLYHIGLGIFRRKDKSTIYFGLFCITVIMRNLMVGEVFWTKIFPSFPWNIAMKIEYLCLYLPVPIMATFFKLIFPQEVSMRFVKLTWIPALLYSIITILTIHDIYYRFLAYYQVIILLFFIYIMYALILAFRRKREGAGYALFGFVIYVSVSAYELISFMYNKPELGLNLIGLALFTISFSILLSKRLASTFDMTERLATELAMSNASLDMKVQDRTKELAEANDRLTKLNSQLREWSIIDSLTNVFNRRYWDDELPAEYSRCIAEQQPIAVMLIDIDDFKAYNDTYGHLGGDQVLKQIASVLKNTLLSHAPGALLARYGGEEFAVLLADTTLERAANIGESLRRKVQSLNIPHESSKAGAFATISIGIAAEIPTPDQESGASALLAKADDHLYTAKQQGKNCVITV